MLRTRLFWLLPLAILFFGGKDLFSRLHIEQDQMPVTNQERDPVSVVEQLLANPLIAGLGVHGNERPNWQLVAVSSGTPKTRGWAILADEAGGQTAYIEGEEIRPGMRLQKVHPTEVEISHGEEIWRLPITPPNGVVTPDEAPASVKEDGQ